MLVHAYLEEGEKLEQIFEGDPEGLGRMRLLSSVSCTVSRVCCVNKWDSSPG